MAYGPNHCSGGGRMVLISYTCGRCGKHSVEPYEKQQEKAQGNLQCFEPPEGWLDDKYISLGGGPIRVPFLMCPECGKKFIRFLKNEPLEDVETQDERAL